MTYSLLRLLHTCTVGISLSLFMLRSAWLLADSAHLRQGWIKVVPHFNDSLLIFAAIGMAVEAGLHPAEQPWLMAKIAGLLAYIALGMVALHGQRRKATRIAAMLAALAVFAYVVAVAVTKQPLPGLA
jgi:uncharacterized membrane protein SirB2